MPPRARRALTDNPRGQLWPNFAIFCVWKERRDKADGRACDGCTDQFHARYGHAEQVVYGWGIFLLVGVALSLYHIFSFDA